MPKHKKKGPLSLQGAAKKVPCSSDASVSLRVVHRDSATSGRGLPACVHPSTAQQFCQQQQDQQQQQPDPGMFFLQLSAGSDCLLHTRVSHEVAAGCIQLDEVQQANLRLCPGEPYKFSVFDPSSSEAAGAAAAAAAAAASEEEPSSGEDDEEEEQQPLPFELTDIDLEVRLLPTGSNTSSSSDVEVDARLLTQAFCKQCFGRVLAVNEYVVVDLPGSPSVLLRVTATNSLTAEEQQEAVCYHCFRGLLTPDTQVYISAAAAAPAQQQQQPPAHSTCQATQQLSQLELNIEQQQQQQEEQPVASLPSRIAGGAAAAGLQLLHAVSRAAVPPPTNVVHVFTSDGEWFPVKKPLLRPCIALTKAVRDSGDTAPEVTVPIDTCTFDRVLLFLEAAVLRRPPPAFGIHLLDDLQQAAEHLGLRSLQAHCQELKGSRQAALGLYSFADVQRANASGKVWLLLDGMVLDVGRWLPEHPGGSSIIPAQATDCDCSRFFEMYHASRESFLYLQEFYIGELLASDLPHVPLGGRHAPSADFMAQLKEFTDGFRQQMKQAQEQAENAPAKHL